MKRFLKRIGRVVAYMFQRKDFFTKKLVVGTLTLAMLLYVDIKCQIWNSTGLLMLVILFSYVMGCYVLRFIELKKEDEELAKKNDMPGTITDPVDDETKTVNVDEEDVNPSIENHDVEIHKNLKEDE